MENSTSPIIGLVGLGNPGKPYEKNRHNIGFRVIDACVEAFQLTPKGEKFSSRLFEGRHNDIAIKAIKPTTFMNLSGKSVQSLAAFYKLTPTQIWVIYDDFDLPFGSIRIRPQGSPGTHNGAKSVTQILGTQAFPKIRFGIGPKPEKFPVDQFVLSNFSKIEEETIPKLIANTIEALTVAMDQGLTQAMNLWNGN